jgi:hypothetical protein
LCFVIGSFSSDKKKMKPNKAPREPLGVETGDDKALALM